MFKKIHVTKILYVVVVSVRPSSSLRFAQDYSTTEVNIKEDKMAEDKLPTRAEDFSEWYNQLVVKSDLADYAPVRGCMVVKPYGWAL